ncbi:phage tail spike protein [Alkalibacillus almallahensis]|uniref:phage tail spike protein n=1 Tax=Alkalibacillus almallahensis TaxID=1379154 RepID=UPI001FB8D2B0|nr:phage tail spike protein [Alkalibacillus almallahensis]
MIYIVDGQNDRILSHIRYKYLLENDHTKSKEDWLETFQFTTFADQPFSEHLTKRNKILIPGEDDELIEFTLFRVNKVRRKGRLVIKCYSRASYLDLKKSKSIDVGETDANSAELHTINALANTPYQAGQIAFKGVGTIMFDDAIKPFNYIKRIASEFELEPRFRAQTSGGKIIGRYVDLVDRVGEFRGRTAEFGSDIETLKRKENTKDVVTALRCFGPEREDGTRLIVEVTDEEALQRWGMNGQHLWDDYEPRSTIQEMTEEELMGYGRTELDKRINAAVDYEIDIIDLEHVPGLENKKTRFGDTIHIKDTGFTPPLYVEARIFKFSRDIKNKARKRITLGDFKEFTEEEVDAAWKQLQSEIAKKIDAAQTYDKTTIDSKDQTVFEDGKTFAEVQASSAEDNAKAHANTVANTAESNAKSHADTVASNAENNAKDYAVAQEDYDSKMTEIANDLSDKAGIEYVDGELQLKQGEIPQQDTAPSSPNTGMLWLDTSKTVNVMKRYDGSGWVKATPTDASEVGSYTIAEVDNALSNKVSVTQYDSDMDGVISDINSNSTLIGQNEDAIALKADSSRVDTLEGTVSNHSTELSVMSDEIELKAESSRVDTLEGTVDNHTAELSVMSDEIDLRVEKDGVIGSINLSEEDLKIDVEQIAIQGDLAVSEGNLVLKDGSVTAPKISSREITSEKLLLGNFDNMLENPNFLNNISPHDLQRGSWTLDNNKSHTGKTSLKCTGVDTGDEARVYLGGADAIVVQEGEEYQFSTHVIKTGNSPHNDMVVSLRFADEDLNFVGYEGTTWFYSNDFSHNEWTQINVTGRVPDGAFYVQPTIRIMDDGNNPSYQIDSVKLKSLVDGKLVAGTIESVDINGSTFTAQSGEDGYVRINDQGWYVVDANDNIRIGINTTSQSWSQPAPSTIWFFQPDGEYVNESYVGYGSDDVFAMYSDSKIIITAPDIQMSPITSDLDVQAKLTIERSGSSFNLKSEGTGTSATTYVDFIDANSDRLGYFGYGSTGNTVFYISNNIGDEVRIVGDMNATGSKSAIVDTENYGSRKMYAVEAPDVRFMDVIEVTLSQGEHWVNLDPIFAETINGYSVFPIVQNGGQVRILERENQRFKVYVADNNTEVACWVYGKREGYEDIYLEQVEEVA